MNVQITCEKDQTLMESLRPSIDADITETDETYIFSFSDQKLSRLQGKINTFFRLAKVHIQMSELTKEVTE